MALEQQRFGKYRLLRRIAAGGMGEVHLAKLVGPAGFEKLVVIKRLLEQRRAEAKYLEMFFSEARVAAQLNHSNIVQIYETGEVDDVPYIAMEYVHGKSLRKILDVAKGAPGGQLPIAFAGYIIAQLCRGLSFAHNAHHLSGAVMDLIHRDINPLNVLVSYQGEVKIIDFGIAKSELTLDQTQAGTIKGTVVYMSPEQSLGQKLDRRSDLFSVGICLYEALSGHNPFHKGSLGASLDAIRRAAAPPIDSVDPSLQPFATLLGRVLTVRPADRYADCHELADALEAILASGRIARPMVNLTTYMRQLFAEDIKQEEHNLERTDFANLDELPSEPPAQGRGTAVLPPRASDRLDGERTVGRGRPMLQTSSVFAAGATGNPSQAATSERLATTSERGTPPPMPQVASVESTAPQAIGVGYDELLAADQPRPSQPAARRASRPQPHHHEQEHTPILAPRGQLPEAGRLGALLGRATDALAARTPGLAGFWHWLTLTPGKPGGRFGLPAALVVLLAGFGGWLALSLSRSNTKSEPAAPTQPLVNKVQPHAAPAFLEGEIDAVRPLPPSVSSDDARVLQLIEEHAQPKEARGAGAIGLAEEPLPSGRDGERQAGKANKGARPKAGNKRTPLPARNEVPDAYSLRPKVAPAQLGLQFRLRADPPLSVHHNGEITQNPVQLHPGGGLLEFRSGPTNGTFNVRVSYQASLQAVDFTVDSEPWADVYGAGGIKLGRTPLRLRHAGESTPLVLKNPHVKAVQHITLRLHGLQQPAGDNL